MSADMLHRQIMYMYRYVYNIYICIYLCVGICLCMYIYTYLYVCIHVIPDSEENCSILFPNVAQNDVGSHFGSCVRRATVGGLPTGRKLRG